MHVWHVSQFSSDSKHLQFAYSAFSSHVDFSRVLFKPPSRGWQWHVIITPGNASRATASESQGIGRRAGGGDGGPPHASCTAPDLLDKRVFNWRWNQRCDGNTPCVPVASPECPNAWIPPRLYAGGSAIAGALPRRNPVITRGTQLCTHVCMVCMMSCGCATYVRTTL